MKTALFRSQTKSTWFKVNNLAEQDTTEIRIYDEIGGFGINADDFVDNLNGIKTSKIVVRINSPGGSVFEGFAIFNALKNHPSKVEVVIDALAASIASIVALAGDSVTMAKNAYFMIHNPWSLSVGDSTQMRRTADLLDKIQGTLIDTYADKIGGRKEQVSQWMNNETWFTAQDAFDTGFIDGITETTETKNRFDLSLYSKTPQALQEEQEEVISTIRDFETLLREELGLSHRNAKKIASSGWSSLTRDDVSEDDGKMIAQYLDSLRTEIQNSIKKENNYA